MEDPLRAKDQEERELEFFIMVGVGSTERRVLVVWYIHGMASDGHGEQHTKVLTTHG